MAPLRTGTAGGFAAHDAALSSRANVDKASPVSGGTTKIVVVALGLLLSVQFGSMIADAIQAYTPWLLMLCYAGPLLTVAAACSLIGRLF